MSEGLDNEGGQAKPLRDTSDADVEQIEETEEETEEEAEEEDDETDVVEISSEEEGEEEAESDGETNPEADRRPNAKMDPQGESDEHHHSEQELDEEDEEFEEDEENVDVDDEVVTPPLSGKQQPQHSATSSAQYPVAAAFASASTPSVSFPQSGGFGGATHTFGAFRSTFGPSPQIHVKGNQGTFMSTAIPNEVAVAKPPLSPPQATFPTAVRPSVAAAPLTTAPKAHRWMALHGSPSEAFESQKNRVVTPSAAPVSLQVSPPPERRPRVSVEDDLKLLTKNAAAPTEAEIDRCRNPVGFHDFDSNVGFRPATGVDGVESQFHRRLPTFSYDQSLKRILRNAGVG